MTLTFLQGFNNYYNRVIKKYDTLNSYINWASTEERSIVQRENINFNPNDGVNTKQVINWEFDWTPDYIIITDDNGDIISRWFVIEGVRLRGKQYELTIRRDLIVDYWEPIMGASCFIEKANLSNDDPFIFNKEDMTFNQIKTSETLLKDKSNSAWIVGYYDQAYRDSEGNTINITLDDEVAFDKEVNSSLQDWKFFSTVNKLTNIIVDGEFLQLWNYNELISSGWGKEERNLQAVAIAAKFDGSVKYLKTFTGGESGKNYLSDMEEYIKNYLHLSSIIYPNENANRGIFPEDLIEIQDAFDRAGMNNLLNKLDAAYEYKVLEDVEDLLDYNNKVVRFLDSNGESKYYRIKVFEESDPYATFKLGGYTYKSLPLEKGSELYTSLANIQRSLPFFRTYAYEPNNLDNSYARIKYKSYRVTAEQVYFNKYTVTFPSNAYKLKDNPFGMFCLPYPSGDRDIFIKNTVAEDSSLSTSAFGNSELSLKLAQELARKYSGANVIYDIQILPYCPCPQTIQDKGELELNNDPSLFCPIKHIETGSSITYTEGFILFASRSSFTLNIPLDNPIKIWNPKIESQTDMYRLVSPNYSGQFEFNAAKNGGVEYFNVDCTYLPYNPYIHINPNFGGLYGNDFNDCRGLICNGDFSISMMNNAWETYQIQNKNYQNIFNRDIQNMETVQGIQRGKEITQAVINGITGSMAGAMAGNMLGGPGAIAGGAVIGGLASAAGAAQDIYYNDKLRNEALDYKQDQFGYQLGNVQALPQSISKTTSMTYNNKIFPILEYYTCTAEEKEALAYKIAFNGMTVMRVGALMDYRGTPWQYVSPNGPIIKTRGYIKGKLIRISSKIYDDFHIVNAIADEINKGVYIR